MRNRTANYLSILYEIPQNYRRCTSLESRINLGIVPIFRLKYLCLSICLQLYNTLIRVLDRQLYYKLTYRWYMSPEYEQVQCSTLRHHE